MLPGLRFLCAAVVLAVSSAIFGMGATALLRSAHEEFASLPNRGLPPTAVFSQQQETAPALAMLQLAPREEESATSAEMTAPAAEPEPAATAPTEDSAEPDEPPATVSAASSTEPAPPETDQTPAPEAVSPAAAPENPDETTAAAADVPATEPALAAQETAPPPPLEPETTGSISRPTATLTDEDAMLSSSNAVMLGEPVPLPHARPAMEQPKAKPAKKVVKKPAVKRRRVAAYTTPSAPAAQPDPFGF